jgi:PIN domain nuclease of toxin-antitoxin system
LLVDSHVALWWLADNPLLGSGCRRRIESADVVVFSAVTPWELGIERELGKVEFPGALSTGASLAAHLQRLRSRR